MTDLSTRPAGYEVIRACLEHQREFAPRSVLARILGLSPVDASNASWFTGSLGELAVGRQLSYAGPQWTVLHAIPVGDGDSDIDHLLIGPAGVFTLNTKRHSRKKVWVGDQRILVSGQKVDHLRNARFEAARASKLLSRAYGRTVPVTPALVFVATDEIRIRSKPRDVRIWTERTLLPTLKRLKPQLHPDVVAAIVAVASRESTWSSRPALPVQPALLAEFAALAKQETIALWTRRGWLAAGLLVAAGIVVPAIADSTRLF